MRRVLLTVVVVSLIAALTGCGSDTKVTHVDPTIPILGSWQPISGTEDLAPVAMSTAMNWDPTWDRGILQFVDTERLNLIGFQDLSRVGTVRGSWTWTPAPPSVPPSPDQLTTTLNGEVTNIGVLISGNVLTATFSRNAHNYVTTWVKVVDLSEFDPLLVRSWQASSVTLNGTATPTGTYFGLADPANTVRLTLAAAGAGTAQEVSGGSPVGAVRTGKWFTGGGEFGLSVFRDTVVPPNTFFASETRGFYTVGAQLTTTFVDVNTGQTVVIVWDPV